MRGESGVQELRKLVNMANNTREDAFDGLSALDCVKLLQACRACDVEVLPDELTDDEIHLAISDRKTFISAINATKGV